MEACLSGADLATAPMSAARRQELVAERSELRQSLRGLDDQRAALLRKIARLDAALYGAPVPEEAPCV